MPRKKKRGRPPGPTDKTTKLVERIYKYRERGWTAQRIADKLKVSRAYVYQLVAKYEP
jgi:orotate phosphoribosyltransferase-like protein